MKLHLLFSTSTTLNIPSQDGEKLDTEKQLAEGDLVIEDDITKVKTKVSEVETELLDTSVFAGADVNQVGGGRF